MKRACYLLIAAVALALPGCGGSSGGNSGGGGTTLTSPEILYSVEPGTLSGSGFGSTLSSFSINAQTGVLTQLNKMYVQSNWGNLFIDPQGPFLYVEDSDPDTGIYLLDGFKLDSSGGMTPLSGSPFQLAGSANGAGPFAINPISHYLYLMAVGSLISAKINSDGSLTNASQMYLQGGAEPAQAVTDATGTHLYISEVFGGIDVVETGADGSMSEISGSPFDVTSAQFALYGIALDPSGKFLYTNAGDEIQVDSITANGGLQAINGSPFAAPDVLTFIEFNPAGTILYAPGFGARSDGSDIDPELTAYNVSGSSGGLNAIPGFADYSQTDSTVELDGFRALAIDPSGQYLYVSVDVLTDETSGTVASTGIMQYTIDSSTGLIKPINYSPAPIPFDSNEMVIVKFQ